MEPKELGGRDSFGLPFGTQPSEHGEEMTFGLLYDRVRLIWATSDRG